MEGRDEEPFDVFVDKTGHIFVTDRGNKRVEVFDREGEFVTVWGEDVFFLPTGIVVVDDGGVVVSDTGKYQVFIFE